MHANLTEKSSRVVLVVDDDDDYRSIVKDIMSIRRPDITILEACDGMEAIRLLSEMIEMPNVIFMDLEMPHLDGKGTMKHIREDGNMRSIAVLIISSLPVENQRQMTSEAADGYIAKSAEIEHLDQLVEMAASYCDSINQ